MLSLNQEQSSELISYEAMWCSEICFQSGNPEIVRSYSVCGDKLAISRTGVSQFRCVRDL